MKQLLLILIAIQSAWAGTGTCVVRIEKVKEITIEEDRIVIRGDAMTSARVESDKEYSKNSVYGRPTQDVTVRSIDGEFVIIPFSTPGYHVVTVEANDEKSRKFLDNEWWQYNLKNARNIKLGDKIEIHYQGGEMSIVDFKLAKVVGAAQLPGHLMQSTPSNKK